MRALIEMIHRVTLLRPAIGIALLCGAFSGCTRTPVARVPEVEAKEGAIQDSAPVWSETDWPQWRGPNGNGFARSGNPVASWNEQENIVWTADIPGRGHASPVVAGDSIYLSSALEDVQKQLVVAFDRSTGAQKWQTVLHEGGFPTPHNMHRKGSHANSTPAWDGERLITVFLNAGHIHVSALAPDGSRLWHCDAGTFSSKFGYAPSPVLYKSVVLIAADHQDGGFLAALDRETGNVVWRTARPAVSTYSSPLVARIRNQDQLVLSGAEQVTSYDPMTGNLLWSASGTAESTCGTVVTNGTVVFASGGYPEHQTVAVAANGTSEVLWENSSRIYEPSMIVIEDGVLGITDEGVATYWDSQTGNTLWRKRIAGSFSASPTAIGNRIYMTAISGETHVLQVSRTEGAILSMNRMGDDCYSSPVISGDLLFHRVGHTNGGARSERLYCYGK